MNEPGTQQERAPSEIHPRQFARWPSADAALLDLLLCTDEGGGHFTMTGEPGYIERLTAWQAVPPALRAPLMPLPQFKLGFYGWPDEGDPSRWRDTLDHVAAAMTEVLVNGPGSAPEASA